MAELVTLMEGAAVEYEEYRTEYEELKAKHQQRKISTQGQVVNDLKSVRETIK